MSSLSLTTTLDQQAEEQDVETAHQELQLATKHLQALLLSLSDTASSIAAQHVIDAERSCTLNSKENENLLKSPTHWWSEVGDSDPPQVGKAEQAQNDHEDIERLTEQLDRYRAREQEIVDMIRFIKNEITEKTERLKAYEDRRRAEVSEVKMDEGDVCKGCKRVGEE